MITERIQLEPRNNLVRNYIGEISFYYSSFDLRCIEHVCEVNPQFSEFVRKDWSSVSFSKSFTVLKRF